MKLARVQIAGYRSISEKITVHVDPQVTVLLGANDHGKTNILEALTHLNSDVVFDATRDLNWDHTGDPDNFPFLQFHFDLDTNDRERLLAVARKKAEDEAPAQAKAAVIATKGTAASAAATAVSDPDSNTTAEPAPPPLRQFSLEDVPTRITAIKQGLTGKLAFTRAGELPEGSATAFMSENLPRVELIHAQDKIEI